MKQSLVAMLNDSEQSLVRETEPARLAQLDEDELIELHGRVRRARTKYTTQYRRGAARRVTKDASRGRASATNQKAAAKAEIFEDVLARVSRRLATVARAAASDLRSSRLEAARAGAAPTTRPGRTKPARTAKARTRGRAPVKRGGDDQLRSPSRKKAAASTRATGKRRQAKRDSR
jgi:hypothetical protein